MLSIIVIASSCKKNDEVIHYVPDNLKQMTPYTNGQQLVFSSGASQVNATVSIQTSIIPLVNCIICDRYEFEENIAIKFMVGNAVFVDMFLDIRPFIFMKIKSPIDNFIISGNFDVFVISEQVAFACSAVKHNCLPSVTINGKQYFDVVEITSGGIPEPNLLAKAWYSKTKGLIGFIYGSGLLYNLVD